MPISTHCIARHHNHDHHNKKFFCVLVFMLPFTCGLRAPDLFGDDNVASVSSILSEAGCGRATGYAETNKIVSWRGKTHVAWLDSEDKKFKVRVRTIDRVTGRWSQTHTVGEAYDNHGGPAITIDSQGYLHIVYYPHHHPFRYRRSLLPNDASKWTEELQVGKKCTYPTLVCGPDDTLYLTCRESATDPWVVNLYQKPKNGDWSAPRTIIAATTRSYSHFQETLAWGPEHERLHLSCRIYGGNPRRGHTIGYMYSDDRGTNWHRGDGSKITLPATSETIEVVANKEGEAAPGEIGFRGGALAVDVKNRPWILYSDYDSLPLRSWLAHRDAEGWQSVELGEQLDARFELRSLNLPGGLTFDERGLLWIALTLMAPGSTADTTVWGHPSSEVILLVSPGGSGPFTQRLISRPDPERPHWLPNLERPTGHNRVLDPGLIYTDGSRGENNRQIVNNRVLWSDLAVAEAQQLIERPQVECLRVERARRVIVDESLSPFVSGLNRKEIIAFTRLPLEKGHLANWRREARKAFVDAVRPFTGEEEVAISKIARGVAEKLSADFPLVANFPWRFVKVDNSFCGGFSHTRALSIIFSERTISRAVKLLEEDGLDGAVQAIGPLFLHEKMHVMQRAYPERFAKLYRKVFGFERITPPRSEWLDAHQASNPDAPETDWVFRLELDGGPVIVWPRSIFGTDDDPEGMTFQSAAFFLRSKNGAYELVTKDDGSPHHETLNSVEEYAKKFPGRAGIDHPNELSAYLFQRVLSGKAFEGKPEHAELLRGFEAWCRTALR